MFGDQRNFHSTSDSSEDNHYTRKRKYKPYEEISGEFKKIKPTTFNRENERILRAHEELNQILTERFHAEGRGKRADS